MRTIQEMVQSEVLCCMSSMVSTLAQGYGGAIKPHSIGEKELAELCEKAAELAAPILDYEEAAIQAGWNAANRTETPMHPEHGPADDWQDACNLSDIEPIDRDIFEHWAVTDWLADKLIAAGEKVDEDFAGLCVWARTTTGQAIYCDGVIERIYAETHKD